ncbi:MAG: hypothetical protein KDA96_23450, partial [Planctomycetaceae bacterium]|nr:hypothetical protein [Planctomycetaceae bacterium]
MKNLDNVLGSWAQWMLHAGWQAAAVALCALCFVWVMRRRLSPQFQYAVLCVALLKFVTPPFLMGSAGLLESTSVFSLADWPDERSFRVEMTQVIADARLDSRMPA